MNTKKLLHREIEGKGRFVKLRQIWMQDLEEDIMYGGQKVVGKGEE